MKNLNSIESRSTVTVPNVDTNSVNSNQLPSCSNDRPMSDNADHNVITTHPIKTMTENYVTMLHSLNLPNSTINTIISSTSEVFNQLATNIDSSVETCSSLSEGEKLNVLNTIKELKDPLQGLETTYKRERLFQNCKTYVGPIPVTICTRFDKKWNKDLNIYTEVPVNRTFMYIHILQTLKVLLSNESVLKLFEILPGNTENVLSDISDGSCFKGNPLFSENLNAIRIQLFFDDFKTVNPLGSKSGIRKIGGIYMNLRNIPPHLNSNLNNIHLVALF